MTRAALEAVKCAYCSAHGVTIIKAVENKIVPRCDVRPVEDECCRSVADRNNSSRDQPIQLYVSKEELSHIIGCVCCDDWNTIHSVRHHSS